jgi:hypothetical protein
MSEVTAAPAVNVDALIAKYIELRDAIDRIEKKAKEDVKPLEAAMETISSGLMDLMNRSGGLTQFKSAAGTAFIQKKTQCSIGDWTQTLPFIIENQQWQLLNKAVNKTAVEEYIARTETPPPGVKWVVMREVQVRRPK